MRDGVENGVITQSEYLVAKLASDHKIPNLKRVSNTFIEAVKRDDVNLDGIPFDRIKPIDDLIPKIHDGGP